jgi:hypothetical protein
MNTIFSIILGVIVIVLLYLVYTYYFSSSTTISSSLWLSNNNAPVTTIANPNTSVFTYGVWIYINTWSQAPMNIFSCGTQGQTYFSLDLPTSSPTLTCTINTGTTACSQGTSQTIVITNNFGIQRWVYVLVSVNTNIVDAYLDGKLVNSTQLNGIPNISCPSNNWAINYGSGDIYISNFKRWTSATDPATALSYYRQTRPASSKIFSSYSANVQLSVDNVPQQPIKIF